jgi:hypothetical protein
VCARLCSTIPKRRTERIIFCCRCYVDGPVFLCLSIRPLFYCVYIFVCVPHALILRVPHTCTYFHFFLALFFFSFFYSLFDILWIISRQNEERESNLNKDIHTSWCCTTWGNDRQAVGLIVRADDSLFSIPRSASVCIQVNYD